MDNKDVINCPACNEVMTKVYMPEAGINIDICLDGCGGMLFDNRELEKFDEKHENIEEVIKATEGKSFKKVNEDEVRICPICKVPMVKMGSGKVNVQIDVCNTCGAKFLDNGELKKIRNNKEEENNRIAELMDDMYSNNMNSLLGQNANKIGLPGYKKRREFFEQIVRKMI